jgi:hypothetical protein
MPIQLSARRLIVCISQWCWGAERFSLLIRLPHTSIATGKPNCCSTDFSADPLASRRLKGRASGEHDASPEWDENVLHRFSGV